MDGLCVFSLDLVELQYAVMVFSVVYSSVVMFPNDLYFIVCLFKVNIAMPVSYTHLDVYKRQVQ